MTLVMGILLRSLRRNRLIHASIAHIFQHKQYLIRSHVNVKLKKSVRKIKAPQPHEASCTTTSEASIYQGN